MDKCEVIRENGNSVYDAEMTNEEYREELRELLDGVQSNKLLRYFYIFVSEKIKRAL